MMSAMSYKRLIDVETTPCVYRGESKKIVTIIGLKWNTSGRLLPLSFQKIEKVSHIYYLCFDKCHTAEAYLQRSPNCVMELFAKIFND